MNCSAQSAQACVIRASAGISTQGANNSALTIPVPLGFVVLDPIFTADHCRLINSINTVGGSTVSYTYPTNALFFGIQSTLSQGIINQTWILNKLRISGELVTTTTPPFAVLPLGSSLCSDGLVSTLEAMVQAGWPALSSFAGANSIPPPEFDHLQRFIVPGSLPTACWSLETFTAIQN
jgi:hypothetical protein